LIACDDLISLVSSIFTLFPAISPLVTYLYQIEQSAFIYFCLKWDMSVLNLGAEYKKVPTGFLGELSL